MRQSADPMIRREKRASVNNKETQSSAGPRKQRNGWIDILRLMFAVLIVLFHTEELNIDGENFLICPGGYIGVEFFFLVSGFLMAATAARQRNTEEIDTGTLTIRFVRRKISVFFPYYVVAFLFALITWMIRFEGNSRVFWMRIREAFFEFVLMKGIGLGNSSCLNSPTWYLSAMVLCMLAIYPWLIRKRKLYTHICVPVTSVIILAHFYSQKGGIQQNPDLFGINYWRILRAFVELNLGCVCYEVSSVLSQKQYGSLKKGILTCAEIALYAFPLILSFFTKADYDYILLFSLMAGVTLSFSGVTYTSSIPSGKASAFLGKFSLVLYLNHRYWEWLLNAKMPEAGFWQKFPVFLALSVVSAFIVMLIVDGGKALLARKKEREQSAADI